MTEYKPNFEKLSENKDNIVIAAGTYAKKGNTWLFKTAKRLSEEINCELVVFPGHHASFMDDTENWAIELKKTLKNNISHVN